MVITIADHYPLDPSWAITKDIDIATKMSAGPEATPLKEARQRETVMIASTVENMAAPIRIPQFLMHGCRHFSNMEAGGGCTRGSIG